MGVLGNLLKIKNVFPVSGALREQDLLLEEVSDQISLFYCKAKDYGKFPALKYQAEDMSRILEDIGRNKDVEKKRREIIKMYTRWKTGIDLVEQLASLRLDFGILFNMIASAPTTALTQIMALRLSLWEAARKMEIAIGLEDYPGAQNLRDQADAIYIRIVDLHDSPEKQSRPSGTMDHAATLTRCSSSQDVPTLLAGE